MSSSVSPIAYVILIKYFLRWFIESYKQLMNYTNQMLHSLSLSLAETCMVIGYDGTGSHHCHGLCGYKYNMIHDHYMIILNQMNVMYK